MDKIFLLLLALALVPPATRSDAQEAFARGDGNGDSALDISDPVAILLHLFGGRGLDCPDAADANDDGEVDISDGVSLLDYVFLDSAPPPPPFPGCGLDPTDDELSCPSFAPCNLPSPPVSVASFNVENLNQAKLENEEILDILVSVARTFDLLVVQEMRDAGGTAPGFLLDAIHAIPGPAYAMRESARLGGTEQYVFYFRTDRFDLLELYEYPAPDGAFERGVVVARFRSGSFDFTLLSIHANHVGTADELSELAGIVRAMLEVDRADRDLIVLGDLNADCGSFDEGDGSHPLRAPPFHWIIADHVDTTVDSGRDCTLDRIILLETTLHWEYRPGSAGVFRYDAEYGLDPGLATAISDHYPVYAEFETSRRDDD